LSPVPSLVSYMQFKFGDSEGDSVKVFIGVCDSVGDVVGVSVGVSVLVGNIVGVGVFVGNIVGVSVWVGIGTWQIEHFGNRKQAAKYSARIQATIPIIKTGTRVRLSLSSMGFQFLFTNSRGILPMEEQMIIIGPKSKTINIMAKFSRVSLSMVPNLIMQK
jgi:hypothetical protein